MALTVSVLLEEIRRSTNPDFCDQALNSLNDLIKDDASQRVEFVELGGVDALLTACNVYVHYPQVLHRILSILRMLSRVEDFRLDMMQRNTVTRLLQTMKQHPKDELVMVDAENVLANLAHNGMSWVPDEAVDKCTTCQRKFGLFRGRHHCRHCGRLFCGECSARSSLIPVFGYTVVPVRACNTCFALLDCLNKFASAQQPAAGVSAISETSERTASPTE